MQSFSCSPAEIVRSLFRNRELVLSLVARDVLGRYRGSVFGILWSLFHPIAMLLIYTLVFSGIFKSRWGFEGTEATSSFAITLFAGLLTFNLFSESMTRAPSLIVANANFVKKVVFPLEVLSIVSVLSASFHLLVSLGVLVLAQILISQAPPLTAIFFPLVLVPLVLFSLGVSWFLSSLSVFFRDIAQATGLLASVLLFLSAVFFPIAALPEGIRPFLSINPLAMMVEASRNILIVGTIPGVSTIIALWVVGIASSYLGLVWFQQTRKGFADVI